MLEHQIDRRGMQQIDNSQHLHTLIDTYTQTITQACEHAIPRRTNTRKLTVVWWSEHLESMKKRVKTLRRRIRCAAKVRIHVVVEAYLKAKDE
jgi:hypothetical protein